MSAEEFIVWGNGTSRTVRVLWALLELGLHYQHHRIGSRTGETHTIDYMKLNPQQKIPTLQHGDLVLTESAAIIQYLSRLHEPPKGFLVPKDPITQAKLDQWSYFVTMELDAHSLYLIRRHEGLPHLYGSAPEAVASAREYFLKQIHAVDEKFSATHQYLLGSDFSTADILLMSTLDWAKLYGFDLPAGMHQYHQRVAKRPFYQQVMRINYPDWFSGVDAIPKPLKSTLVQ